MAMLDRGMIPIPEGKEQDGTKFHHAIQNCIPFKTYESFISGTFHLILLDHGWLWVTETLESQTADKESLLYTEK